jgi:hypothetical protein
VLGIADWGKAMKAFLSHSSKDKWFVSKVFEILGESQCEYDEKTFDYALNVHAIRTALNRSNLFVMFLSENSISSTFVSEEQRSALEKRGKNIIRQVIVFAIDDTSYRELPEWMREINIVQRLSSPKACARRVQSILWAMQAEVERQVEFYLGRDEDEAAIRKALSMPAVETPIALHAVGYYGVGRRTFIRESLKKFLPRVCEVFVELNIEKFDGFEEIYRKIYEAHHVSSLETRLSDFDKFSKMSIEQKSQEVACMIAEMSSQGEFIIFVDEGGVYTDSGDYQKHLLLLLTELSDQGKPVVGFSQTRMMPYHLRESYGRTFHRHIQPLNEETTKELLSLKLKAMNIEFNSGDIDVISEFLDGHPFNVRFAVNFISSYGIKSIVSDPSALIEWKNKRAKEFLERIEFAQIDTDILAALSEYVMLSFDTIFAILPHTQKDVAARLRVLEEFCCIERKQGYFTITPPIREAARRDKRFERNDNWKQEIGKAICSALKEYSDSDHVPVGVLQSATIAAAYGADAPRFLSALILPSHLLRIAKEFYDGDKRVLSLQYAKKAYESKDRLTEDGQIEALRLWGLASIRTSNEQNYQEVVDALSTYSSSVARRIKFFLEGFRLRLKGRFDEAETQFLEAWKLGKRNQSTNRELASLYCKQKRYADAEMYARAAYKSDQINPYILDIMAETLLGKLEAGLDVDGTELMAIIDDLKTHGDAPGLSFYLVREAQQLMRQRRYGDALAAINKAVERTSGLLAPYFMRAEIHLAMGSIPGAERDANKIDQLLKATGGFSKEDEARLKEIEIRIYIEKRQFNVAKDLITRSGVLPGRVCSWLYDLLARAVCADPSKASESIKQWAQGHNAGRVGGASPAKRR